MARLARGRGCLQQPSLRPAPAQHLISLCEGIEYRAEDSWVHHCRCVEAQPGKVHGNLHTKVVTDFICQGDRGSWSALPASWDPYPPLAQAAPRGWFSHTACTHDFMRRFKMRCSWTGNTCWIIPRAASSGTVGGQEWVTPSPLPVPGLARPPWLKPKSQLFVCS